MRLYNSIYKKVVDFKPLNSDIVTMYACGPTVYKDAHIGNFRTYLLSDLLYRSLKFYGYNNIKFIMNLTDVGHLVGDSDSGEDKIEKSAKEEGKTAKDIAEMYTNKFLVDYDRLNLTKPNKFTKATEYIDDQIKLIKILEQKGYTYRTSDGIYYDTSKFDNYGQLSGLKPDSVKESRIDLNPEKKNATDFALWKFSNKEEKRQQEWMSPWGMGFPGWHIECSAMCLAELGETVDIHVGADDLKMIHHQNEIAQSEAATDKKFVKYWVHGGFLTVDETTMSKSLGNVYTVTNVMENGFDPIALRYFYMTAHYRIPLNFTWNALKNAQNSLNKMYEIVEGLKEKSNAQPSDKHLAKFNEATENDLNMPRALAVMWELLKSDLEAPVKVATILKMDKIFGFKIDDHVGFEIPENVLNLAKSRQEYRKNGIWDKADMVRKEINSLGYVVNDNPDNTFEVRRKL